MASARNDHDNAADPKSPDGGTPSNTEKDPSEWTTGDEPMTGAQASYLKTLSEEAKEEFDRRERERTSHEAVRGDCFDASQEHP